MHEAVRKTPKLVKSCHVPILDDGQNAKKNICVKTRMPERIMSFVAMC